MSVTSRVETITPKKAAQWLENKAPNRPVSEVFARQLSSAITSGEWKLNGDAIRFNGSDQMEDGQHRCLAVVMANKPIQSLVVRGLDNDVFETIDGNRKRTLADMFSRAQEKHYTILAGAVSWLYRFRNGTVSGGRQDSPRHPQSFALLNENPEIHDSVARVLPFRCKLLSPSLSAAMHYMAARISRDAADRFFDHLLGGENIAKASTETSAIYWLRARLQDNRENKAKLPVQEVIALTIKAWDAFRAKRITKTLRWSSTESFPEFK
jgi:hypothetical protein